MFLVDRFPAKGTVNLLYIFLFCLFLGLGDLIVSSLITPMLLLCPKRTLSYVIVHFYPVRKEP